MNALYLALAVSCVYLWMLMEYNNYVALTKFKAHFRETNPVPKLLMDRLGVRASLLVTLPVGLGVIFWAFFALPEALFLVFGSLLMVDTYEGNMLKDVQERQKRNEPLDVLYQMVAGE
jgi:hypothetical protein